MYNGGTTQPPYDWYGPLPTAGPEPGAVPTNSPDHEYSPGCGVGGSATTGGELGGKTTGGVTGGMTTGGVTGTVAVLPRARKARRRNNSSSINYPFLMSFQTRIDASTIPVPASAVRKRFVRIPARYIPP